MYDLVQAVIRSGISNSTHFKVLIAIADCINSQSLEWAISFTDLQRLSRCGRRQMFDAIKELEQEEILVIKRRPDPKNPNNYFPNIYSINRIKLAEKYPPLCPKGNRPISERTQPLCPKGNRPYIRKDTDISKYKEDISNSISSNAQQNKERHPSEIQTSSSAKPMTTEQSSDLFGYQENSNQTQAQQRPKITRPPCPPCPYEKLVELYHRTLPELPKVAALNSSRRTNMQARWRECYKDGDFNTEEEGLRQFEYVFVNKIRSSDFLMGKVQQKDGNTWKCNIDFIFKSTYFLRILEGYYANHQSPNN